MDEFENSTVNTSARLPVPALRIVHLAGGLRAIDFNEGGVWIEVTPEYRLAHFPTPQYPELYAALEGRGFRVVGVDFLVNHALVNGAPPDWEVASTKGGFYAMNAERVWRRVRYAASKSGNSSLEVLAAKAVTYLRLLPMRIRQLSEAYNSSLARAVSAPNAVTLGHHFDNEWTVHIDAAIHAFLADAGALRDVLAETIWRLILGNDDNQVTSLGGLLKKTKEEIHPLVVSLRADAESGWLYKLTDLRNHIVHVAPVSDSQEHHMCELRALVGPQKQDVPSLHLALLQGDGSVRKPSDTFVDYRDHEAIEASLSAYHEYVRQSLDALNVCSNFCEKLVELSVNVKDAGNFDEMEVILTKDDFAGPVIFC